MTLDLQTRPTVFRCPQCKQFINDKMAECSHCGTAVDRSRISTAVDQKEKEQRDYRRRHYASHIPKGLVVFLIAAAAAVALYMGLHRKTLQNFCDALESVMYESDDPGRLMLRDWIYGGYCGLIYAAICCSLGGLGDFLYGLVGWLGEMRRDAKNS